jgi:hypothetical protein
MISHHFHNQVERLVELRYPVLFGLDALAFRAALEPLAQYIPPVTSGPDVDNRNASFTLVINSPKASVRTILPLVTRIGKSAVERLHPIQPGQFLPTGVGLPDGQAYLILDFDQGRETLNVTPDAALEVIISLHRSPVTVEMTKP